MINYRFRKENQASLFTKLEYILPTLKENTTYNLEIKQYRAKRSLNANAYCWVLIDKIAEQVGVKKEDVYRRAILEIGGVSVQSDVPNEDVEEMCRLWSTKGIGWQTEIVERGKDTTTVLFYKGSSEYNTEQMKRLIDSLIQDAQALDIETKTPDEIDRMVSLWGEKCAV